MKFSSPVSRIPKIGPKYQKLLTKLEIKTVGDLLYHFPFRYNDYSQIKNISELQEGDTATTKSVLENIKTIYTKSRKRITRAKIQDTTGEIEIIWFNMPYMQRSLKPGTTYNVSGTVTKYNYKLCFINPDMERVVETKSINTGCLVPIYPETASVTSKWLRTRINDVLELTSGLDEFLPEKILKKHNLIEYKSALKQFHFPNSQNEVDEAKKRFSYEELLLELLRVQKRKESWSNKLVSVEMTQNQYKDKLGKFTRSLPFNLSESQIETLDNIFADISASTPMNRLLGGDVGSGKTVVAVISSYLTYLNGYKTIYMAPTEILAEQHYKTFTEFLGSFGPKINLKTGRSKKIGDFDIVIGTHALLYLENNLENVGLVVIDEQHRFGVEQRAELIEFGKTKNIPHLLTMTATPIPRTLALTLYGDLSISTIEVPTDKYKNIKTWVVGENKREAAFKWVSKQNVPVFVVCPLIEESMHETLENVKAAEVEYEKLKEGYFTNLRVGLLHGRIKSAEKRKVIEDFSEGRLDVLVSTPVIEVGVDIPDATIMVIESAERYGLASLHQLRGRVGRLGQEAYCILFTSKYSRNAYKRLMNLKKYSSGLELAEIDMKLRGKGDIYGTKQHGFMRFKVAKLSDTKLLETAKEDSEMLYAQIEDYPMLAKKLKDKTETLVSDN